MAALDVTVLHAGTNKANQSSYATSATVTFDPGHLYVICFATRLTGGVFDANKPSVSDDASGTITYANRTTSFMYTQRGGTVWTATVTAQQAGVTFTFDLGTDTAGWGGWSIVKVDSGASLAQAIAVAQGAALSGPPYTLSVSYGATTDSGTLDLAFFWADAADLTWTQQSGWTKPSELIVGAPDRGGLSTHYELGSNTQATADADSAGSTSGVLALEIEAAGGITQPVGQATETDTVLAATIAKALAAGLVTEADTVLGLSVLKVRTIGLTSEADSALAAAHSRSADAGLTTETDESLAVTSAGPVLVGLSEEVDSALAASHARALAAALASETDTPLAAGHARSADVGLSAEVDEALAVVASGPVQVGLSEEVDSALSAAHARALAAALALETDTPLGVTINRAVDAGLPTEADTALPVAASEARAVGLAAETSEALAVVASGAVPVGLATEADQAFGIQSLKFVTVAQSTETDAALAVTTATGIPVGLSTETDLALAVDVARTVLAGLAAEADVALGALPLRIYPLGLSLEADSALAVSPGHQYGAGLAVESDAALVVVFLRALAAGLATETDEALAVVVIGGAVTATVYKYAPEHAQALRDVQANGKAVTLTHRARTTYDPLAGTSTVAETSVAGWAMRISGSPRTYEALGLVEREAPTFLFVPSTYGESPELDAVGEWAGRTYRVAAVDPVAPDGAGILFRVIMSLQDEDAQPLDLDFVFQAEHASAYRDVLRAGAALTFTDRSRVYNPTAGTSSPTDASVVGAALRKRGDRREYERLGLVDRDAVTLLFVPQTYGELPTLGATCPWQGAIYTVRDVRPLAPDGAPIIANVVVSK